MQGPLWVERELDGRRIYFNTLTKLSQYTRPLALEEDEPETALTEDLTVLSSPHGRQRRRERKIDKLDLQAALKYGVKTPSGVSDPKTGRPRWMYTHGDIVLITDEFSKKEVTSFQLPAKIDPVQISTAETITGNTQRMIIALDPTRIASHIVCVVDQSGSMRKGRCWEVWEQTVYTSLAKFLVEKQLSKDAALPLDAKLNTSLLNVVSLIEMRETAEVVFEAEPLNWELFNTFIRRRDDAKPHFDGNYLPSLDAAERLLSKFSHGGCALLLLFLSDGKPSDLWAPGASKTPEARDELVKAHAAVMRARVSQLTQRFGRRLTVGTIGFADQGKNFTMLQEMAEEAKAFSLGMYLHARSDLGLAITSLVTSLTSTVTEMTATDGSRQRRVKEVTREKPELSTGGQWLGDDFWLYPRTERWQFSLEKGDWVEAELESKETNGLVIRKSIFGEGAERIVYAMREARITYLPGATAASSVVMQGGEMVAKESRFVDDLTFEQFAFHKIFAKTQLTSQKLATAFNAALQGHDASARSIPRVSFLHCTAYLVEEGDEVREVLAEKRLDVSKYKKWNSNGGFVHGQKQDVGALADLMAGCVIEEEEEDEGDDDEGDDSALAVKVLIASILPEHIPQAFSHFSYQHSKKKMLVCDLQGVYDSSQRPPLFELTDPVIHHVSHTGQAQAFGRTDRGKKGVHAFFRTHKCNAVCQLLKLREWNWTRR